MAVESTPNPYATTRGERNPKSKEPGRKTGVGDAASDAEGKMDMPQDVGRSIRDVANVVSGRGERLFQPPEQTSVALGAVLVGDAPHECCAVPDEMSVREILHTMDSDY